MLSRCLLILLVMMVSMACHSQADTLAFQPKKKSFLKKSIAPISLMAVSSVLSSSRLERDIQRETRNLVGNRFSSRADDYLRYAPIVQMLGANAFGVPAKNHWFDQAKNWTIAWYVTDLLTFKLKDWVRKPRPDYYDRFSFPSGHTSFAFMNASVLYEEYKDTAPWLAYSGYAFASTTGFLRVTNNAHFISDVMFSAGLAMIVTKLVYWIGPIVKWNPFKKIEGVTLLPQKFQEGSGFYLAIRL